MDTCHIHDAGYDIVGDLDGVLRKFDRIVGLDRIAVVHINDSKNPRGAAKDRHAPIGSGWIGYRGDQASRRSRAAEGQAVHPRDAVDRQGQQENERPMYEAEIALLRGDAEERFGDDFFEDVERLHHFFDKEANRRADVRALESGRLLKSDAKAKKADPREPMDRLYDMVIENRVLSGRSDGGSGEPPADRLVRRQADSEVKRDRLKRFFKLDPAFMTI